MGLFSKEPSPKEVKQFAKGRAASAKAAEAYARQQRDQAAARRAQAAIKAGWKGRRPR